MGSNSNIMPAYLFKKLFPNIDNDQLVATVSKCILLKTYNKTTVTQLGTCKVIIEHKSNKKVNFCSSWEWTGIVGPARH